MTMSGGDRIADVLKRHGVRFLFTLCGGHISPILVSAKARGIRVVDVRHEATAVFAADAVARLTGIPGVAAVTAGPGATNAVTAVKNAQMAQSPLVLLGGATATLLRGRGSLQDIDQIALLKPHTKWTARASRVSDIAPLLEEAFARSRAGVPGPVFLECPVDLLYPEAVVAQWYAAKTQGPANGLADGVRRFYVRRHLRRLFERADDVAPPRPTPSPKAPGAGVIRRAAGLLARSERPVLVVGSQALLSSREAGSLAEAVGSLGLPMYLAGMARGLLEKEHPLLLRHRRREALREADLVVLAGAPCDFRLDYGAHIRREAVVIAANRSRRDLTLNRRPTVGIEASADLFLRGLAGKVSPRPAWHPWLASLRGRDREREAEIAKQSDIPPEGGRLNPLRVCRAIEEAMDDDSVIVADGGDFVSTASYVLRPRGPLSWLDPGVFGTLGVGAGFALAAKLVRPQAEVWVLYGDGSVGFSLAEADSFVRHGLSVIAFVGNDASWTQIAREQVEVLGDDVGTVLRPTSYHRAADGLGAVGLQVEKAEALAEVLGQAKAAARAGRPVYVNALLGRTDFRKGAISI
jgi:acetolactate synthase-1/2/3 large subunit